MLRSPPHILITTPESLGLALASKRFRPLLNDMKWMVIDEMHSLVPTKRDTSCLESGVNGQCNRIRCPKNRNFRYYGTLGGGCRIFVASDARRVIQSHSMSQSLRYLAPGN